MGEKQNRPFQLPFNAFLKVGFKGCRVTSDGGLGPLQEFSEQLVFGEFIDHRFGDSRRRTSTQFPFANLVRQSASVAWRGRGCEQRRTAVPRSCIPTHRLRKGRKSRSRYELPITDLRDLHTGRGWEFCRKGEDSRGIDRQSGTDGFRLADPPVRGSTNIPVNREQKDGAHHGHI
jgi:hypothetical protein